MVLIVSVAGACSKLKVFVGYASEDRDVAVEVVTFLEGLGLTEVWFDRKSLVAGDDWDAERQAAQRNADLIIHICSEQILSRAGVVNREIRETLRLADDKPFGANFVIFIRINGVRLPAQFLRYHYIDFEGDWRSALAAAIGKKAAGLQAPANATGANYKRDNLNVLERFSRRTIEEKEETHEISVEYIEYKSSDTYWRLVNSEIESESLRAYYEFKSEVPSFLEEMKTEYFRPRDFQLKADEFFCFGEFVSIQYLVYFDHGGAHGNFRTQTSNFFGSQRGKVTIRDLLSHDDDKALRVLSYCLKVVEAGLDEPEPQIWHVNTTDPEDAWRVLENFSFDNRGLTFNFSPYDILPFAAGAQEAFMPWQVASSYVVEKYMEPWHLNLLQQPRATPGERG
ncbi:TIR domain-containing protein [Ensifer sp. 2YAB10]|uniref:TIR domain-containing protein n=1 Tax=unclassified Ensifer TaxID=2633371 RepID=UPI003F8E084D